MNTLYYGDDLKILRDYIKDESVDLMYLDPTSFNCLRLQSEVSTTKNDPALAEPQYGVC